MAEWKAEYKVAWKGFFCAQTDAQQSPSCGFRFVLGMLLGDERCLPLRHLQEGLQNDLRAVVVLAVMEQGWKDERNAA